MKRVHFVLLFVFCVGLALLIAAQDITSINDWFALHPADYIFLGLWAIVLYLMLLPFAMIGHKLLFVTKNK
ncbi:MAG: hypothetical protein AAF564_19090 [Bacteroidota bacterium]